MADVTLEFLGEQIGRLLNEQRNVRRELADMKDDRTVIVAILNRLDSSVHSVTAELRVLRSQFNRFRSHVDELFVRMEEK